MQLIKTSFLLICCWLLIAASAAAQYNTQIVKGTVIDKASEKPLAGISVTVAGMSIGATTDSSGSYKLVNVPVGRQKIAFSSVGYKPVTIPEILITIGKEVVMGRAIEGK